MTGRELFELLREAKTSFEFDPKNNSFYGLKGDIKIGLSDLAKFIDNYFLPHPLFEDGTPVKVGDRFAPRMGVDKEVTGFYVYDDGSFAINSFWYNQDQRVMKPEEKPDSWEQLEEDLDRCIKGDSLCPYYSPSGKCSTCIFDGKGPCHCGSRALEDIKKRIRKLAAKGGE